MCVAVRYSVVQCVAMCCKASVLQCYTVRCSVLQRVAAWGVLYVVVQCVAVVLYVRRSAMQCRAVCCSVLQRECVAVFCSALQRLAACCGVLQRVAACCGVLQREECCILQLFVCQYWSVTSVTRCLLRIFSGHRCLSYGVAMISRLLKIIGLFCKRAL